MRDKYNKRIAITVISIILIFSITFSNTLPVFAQEASNETPTPIEVLTETPEPTSEPTEVLTEEPTVEPTFEPTEVPTEEPTEIVESQSANEENHQAVVFEGIIFTSGTGDICAYQISDSSKVWCFNQLNQIQISGISDSKLIIAGVDNITGLVNLAALDLAQGNLLWQIDLGRSGNQGFHCSPPSNYRVYCSIASSLTSVDLNSQAIEWSLDLDGDGSLPVVNEDRVALVTPSTIYMLGTNNAEVLWTKSLGSDIEVHPIIAGANLILSGSDNNFHALEVSGGNEIWAHPSAGGAPCQAISGDDALIVSTSTGIIERLDYQTGISLWAYDPGLSEMGACPSPVMANGNVYANFSDGSVRGIFDEDGTLSLQQEILGQEEVDQWETLALAISGERLYVASPNGTILEIHDLVESTPTEEPTLEETLSPNEIPIPTTTATPVGLTATLSPQDIGTPSSLNQVLSSGETSFAGSTVISSISAGFAHTCALTSTGGLKCWGWNIFGQLGDETLINRRTPVDVSGLSSGMTAISLGIYHSCALTISGGVKCWGYNKYGQIGDETQTDRSIPTDVSGLTIGVASISADGNHTCALTSSGGIKCWGYNNYGQLGDGTQTDRSIPVDVSGLTSGVIAISTGSSHTCALTSSGSVKCWGRNNNGRLGDGTQQDRFTPVDVFGLSTGVVAISAGGDHTCALTSSGGVKCWGGNYSGDLGDGTDFIRLTPVDVLGLSSGVNAISAGDFHTCALTSYGAALCWGDGGQGRLGDGTGSYRLSPVTVLNLTTVIVNITAGGGHTCALSINGGVKCWGYNYYGEVGDGTRTDRLLPVDVVGLNEDTSAYSVSGKITVTNGKPLPGVTVLNSQSQQSTVTGEDGKYVLTGLLPGIHSLTVEKRGYTFGTTSLPITISDSDIIDINFTADLPQWTIAYYLAGDNNLDSSYNPIFNQIEAGTGQTGVNVTAVWDRLGSDNSAYYWVKPDSNLNQTAAYAEGINRWQKNELNMGAPATLQDFLDWSYSNFPASHYAVVLDDHGGGLTGAMQDETSSNDILTLSELKSVFTSITGQYQKIDLLVMNACLMGMIEDGYQFRDSVIFYTASEDNQTTFNVGYANTLSAITQSTPPRQAAIAFVDGYANEKSSNKYTMSAADLTKVESLKTAIESLAGQLDEDISLNAAIVWLIRQTQVQKFPSNSSIDLYDFARLINSSLEPQTIKDAAQGVMDAIKNDYVIYNRSSMSTANGVSIFFPDMQSSFYNGGNYDFAMDLPSGSISALSNSLNWSNLLTNVFIEVDPGGEDNPTPPGVVSKSAALTDVNPTSVMAGSPDFILTITGTDFAEEDVVYWNGSTRITTFVSSTELTAQIDSTDVASAGSAVITVSNPETGGSSSNSLSFTIIGYSPFYDQKLNSNKVNLDWDNVPDATQYSVQLSLSSAFTNNLINTTTTISEYNYTTALTNGKTYYWRIRPTFGSGVGNWSTVFRFYSMNPPVAPIITSPVNTFLTNNPTPSFSWNSVANASEYEIQIDNASTFTLPIQQTDTTSELTYTATHLDDGLHYWRVRGIDEVGVNGAWSLVRSFTVDTIAPAVPVLSLPAAEASPLGTPAFSWTVPSTAKAYIFEYTTENDGSFATPVYTSAELTTNKVTPPTMATGPYLWHAKARDAAGNWSNWSAAREITILPPIPMAPVLTAPATGSYTNDTTPELNWNEVPYGEEYEVQLSKSKTFLPLVDTLTVEGDSITDVTTNGDGLYYWRVRAINEKEETGAWSGYRTFTLDTVSQAVPVMTSPINGTTIVTVTPTIVVKTVSGAKTYEYEFSSSETIDPVIQTASTTTLSYVLSVAKALPFGTIYYHVRSVDAAGNVSAWSEPYSFVVTILKAPANKAVMVTSTTTRPAFSWTAVSGATGYRLQVDNLGDNFASLVVDKNLAVTSTYTSNSVEALVAGKYEWRMCVKKGAECGEGAWTPVYTFTVTPTPPAKPVQQMPATGHITNNYTPEFSWNTSVNGVKYEIQIDNSSTFTLPIEQSGVTIDTDYQAGELTDGIHYWRVRAINDLDVSGAWSAYRSFTVDTVAPSLPTLSAPAIDAEVRGTPKYTWLAAAGAKYYQFEYASTADFSDVVYTSAELTNLNITPPQQETNTFYWHVRAKDAAGNWGGWSTYRKITILPLLPVAPVLVAPASSSSVSITTPTFSWNPVPYATDYDIQIDNNSNFSSPEAVGATSATWYTSGYLPNATYYWRVQAKNIKNETGAWSAARPVKVNVPANSTTTVVSVSTAGVFGNFGSGISEISENGRFVVFGSMSSNLVNGDTNALDDVFIHDQQTNVTSRVSISSTGIQGNDSSIPADISEDGRFVLFNSSADNLVSDDTNASLDVFVRDRQLNQTTRISVSSSGIEGNERSAGSSISGDGRYVVFSSDASNLTGSDTNGFTDVFLHDRQTGQTKRISLSSTGTQGNGSSDSPSISGDGRFVTFISNSTNLVSGDTNGKLDIYIHNLITGSTNIVSVSSTGTQSNGDSYNPSISRDGRYIAFDSSATNLDVRDTSDDYDVYIYDTVTGETRLVSVTSTGEKGNLVSSDSEISANGLYVAFMSCATNFVSVDTNDMCDIFIHDLLTDENRMASVNSLGGLGDRDSYGPSISGDGRYVSFESDAWGFVTGDYLSMNDVFVHEFR